MDLMRNLFPRINQYPLSYRALGYVLVCSSTFALMSTTAQLYIEYRRDVSNLYTSFEFIENSYLAPISASVYKIDSEHLKLQLNGALNLAHIVHLEVKEQRGDRIIETSVGNLTARNLIRSDFTLSYSDASVQMRNIGSLTVSASLDGVYRRLLSRVFSVLAINAAKTFLASAGILAIIYWLITRHLTQISNYTQTLHPGKQDAPLALKRKPSPRSKADELDRVVMSINALQDRLNQDITRREHYEERLRLAEQKYRTVADYTYDWEYWMNSDGSLEYVSPSCERISGYKARDFMENPALLEEIVIAEDKPIWDGHHCGVKKGLNEGVIQFRIQSKKAGVRWIEHVCQPIPSDSTAQRGFRASNRDISMRKNAELEARRHLHELTHVNRIALLSELGTTYAHEINQPLTAIFSNAQVARKLLCDQTPDLTELSEIVDDIINDNKRAVDIIRRLRSLMKLEELDLKPIDINTVIGDVIEFLRREMLTQNIVLVSELEDDLPLVWGEAIHLQQVLINLVQNSRESMVDCEQSACKIRIASQKIDKKTVKVSVLDSGCGIDSKNIDRIFEAFWTTKSEGIGMGLSICRSIVEAHGGRLWPENRPEGGATFSFTIPICETSGARP